LKPKNIYLAYCTKEISEFVWEQGRKLENVTFTVYLVERRTSLKRIMQARVRDYPLKNGDIIIAIDNSPECMFCKDVSDPRLIYFSTLDEFIQWIMTLWAKIDLERRRANRTGAKRREKERTNRLL
jgi:hypothetical protein